MDKGQWFLLDRDHRGASAFPERIAVYEGGKKVKTITKQQAIAFMRWRDVEWVSVLDGNGRYQDKTVVGDIEAFYEREEA